MRAKRRPRLHDECVHAPEDRAKLYAAALPMPEPPDLLAALALAVPRAANRIASYTNKAAAFYCAQTHAARHPEYTWFEGLNVAKNRIFSGYDLFVNGQLLDNRRASVTVGPACLVRQHGPALQEQLWLFDYKNLLEIDLPGARIELRGKQVRLLRLAGDVAFFSAQEGDFVLAVAARQPGPLTLLGQRVEASGAGFFIACGRDEAEATALLREGQQHGTALKLARQQRMRAILETTSFTNTNDDSLTRALRWLALTTDQLVTRQQGDGIYAGLPWFNEYWGRDEFIALPGAVLVTGQFATARQLLLAFARYQNADPSSKFYGRVPNIVSPGTTDYHTADGTPRFVIALLDYVRYSGDTGLIRQLYPVVQASIAGALAHWVDDQGYLRHADNETWMDARDAQHVAYTPRGSRANDIQALWYQQLRAGAYFAAHLRDEASRAQWQQLAERVRRNFARDYRATPHDYLADRLTESGQADFTLRPNQLFALDLLDDPAFTRRALRTVWTELVYPWGVATLARHDPQFHPYHHSPAYHKDAAYHRGTVWPWLNGIAMQRMLEAGQVETAWQLFNYSNRQALTRGVVGGLGENLDAYPHPGQSEPRLTGAYLQAWSNAEQLRVWYQYFLGIRPDVPNDLLTLAPRLPAVLTDLTYHFTVGESTVVGKYAAAPHPTHTYAFADCHLTVVVDILPFALVEVAVQPDTTLRVTVTTQLLQVESLAQSGQLLAAQTAAPAPARLARQQQDNAVLGGVPFASPLL